MWLILTILFAVGAFITAVMTDSLLVPAIFLGASLIFLRLMWRKNGRK